MFFARLRCMASGRFIVLLSGIATAMVCVGHASAADRKLNAIPAAVSAVSAPSGAELVGRLLQNGPSDPDVPLPQRNLSTQRPGPAALTGPSLYGRQEDGGAVLGLKFPIPATRAAH